MQIKESHSEIDGRLDLKALPLTMCLYMIMLGIFASWIASWFIAVQLGKAVSYTHLTLPTICSV